jgi:hypothetical protein
MKISLTWLFLLLAFTAVESQEPGEEANLQALLNEALKVHITARILPPDQEPTIDVEKTKLTIPGRPVVVRFRGRNIFIAATLTPYLIEEGKLVLVAQGQVWFSDPESEARAIKYLSSMKSIPISLGEKIVFFPLGVQADIVRSEFFNIALEIEVVPFKSP